MKVKTRVLACSIYSGHLKMVYNAKTCSNLKNKSIRNLKIVQFIGYVIKSQRIHKTEKIRCYAASGF
jgi:hypothetical protein